MGGGPAGCSSHRGYVCTAQRNFAARFHQHGRNAHGARCGCAPRTQRQPKRSSRRCRWGIRCRWGMRSVSPFSPTRVLRTCMPSAMIPPRLPRTVRRGSESPRICGSIRLPFGRNQCHAVARELREATATDLGSRHVGSRVSYSGTAATLARGRVEYPARWVAAVSVNGRRDGSPVNPWREIVTLSRMSNAPKVTRTCVSRAGC